MNWPQITAIGVLVAIAVPLSAAAYSGYQTHQERRQAALTALEKCHTPRKGSADRWHAFVSKRAPSAMVHCNGDQVRFIFEKETT